MIRGERLQVYSAPFQTHISIKLNYKCRWRFTLEKPFYSRPRLNQCLEKRPQLCVKGEAGEVCGESVRLQLSSAFLISRIGQRWSFCLQTYFDPPFETLTASHNWSSGNFTSSHCSIHEAHFQSDLAHVPIRDDQSVRVKI